MPRLRVLAPLLALLAPACSGGGEPGFTGFDSAPATTGPGPGPGSFGSDASSAAPTTAAGDTTTTTDSTSAAPTTGEPTTATTGEPTTASDTTALPGTTTDSDTTTGGPGPACGDGVVDKGEVCDDGNQSDADACLSNCRAGTGLLALVGLGTQPATVASYTPGPGWSLTKIPPGVAAAALTATPGGATAVFRRASAKPEEQDELYHASWQDKDPLPLAMTAPVGDFGFAKGGLALAAVGDAVNLVFLGSDNKHYTAQHDAGAWGPFGKLPAGMIPQQAFGPSPATLAAAAPALYAVYVGDDTRLYYSRKSGPGGVWEASVAAPAIDLLTGVSPVAVVDAQDDLVVAYARKDARIAVIKLITPMNAWTPEVLVHPDALTGTAIALARLEAGGYAIAWRGFDTQGIYLTRSAGDAFDKWGMPLTVEVPGATSTPPVLAAGTLGADLEILHTVGGKLRHARLSGPQIVAPVDVVGVVGATSVAVTRVQRLP